MSPSVIQVQPLDNYQLQLHFDNSEIRIFDVTPYLDKGIFSQLKSIDQFQTVKPFFGGIQWESEQDFSRDTLYLLSHPIQSQNDFLRSFSNSTREKTED